MSDEPLTVRRYDTGAAVADVLGFEPRAATPMEMLSRALERGDDLTVLEKLMDLQERHEKNEARKAFDAAVATASAEFPTIKKNRNGHSGRYADMAAFAGAVDPVLARHGLSYRFRTAQSAARDQSTSELSQ